MKYFSTFSGIGGFELGIQLAYEALCDADRGTKRGKQEDQTGNKRQRLFTETGENSSTTERPVSERSTNGLDQRPLCIGFSEIDKYAIQIYQKHFPKHKNYGDITKINAEELPDFDLLVGGFPCQSFSIAGKRGGFADTRGTLFFDIARILREKKPRLCLLENVKGLLSHDGGRTFRTIISTLDELGYDLQWQVLNSKNHGVPQNRERVFIIGHLRGTPRPQVFPFADSSGEDTRNVGEDLSYALDASYAKGTNTLEKGRRQLIQLNNPTHSNDRVYGTDGVSPTLNTMQGGNRQPFVLVPEATKKGYAEATVGDSINLSVPESKTRRGRVGVANTLDTGMQQHTLTSDMQIRRLTPVECERLQGFPETEKYAILEICKQVSASGVEITLNTRATDQENVAQAGVLIDCVENGVEIHSQGKLLLNAKNAEKKNWSHPLIKIDDFVQLLVGINTIKEKVIRLGEEESHQNEQSLTPQKNGERLEKLYGNEMTQPVGDVKNDLIILNELLKLTTLNHSNTENLEQKLQTLSLFVIRVISGYIPSEILNQDTFTIGVRTRVGYTYGVSDTQRYKCCGNAVTVNVIRDIMEKLL
jgi:DNA (cytosine-5)-methyltransferase 1